MISGAEYSGKVLPFSPYKPVGGKSLRSLTEIKAENPLVDVDLPEGFRYFYPDSYDREDMKNGGAIIT